MMPERKVDKFAGSESLADKLKRRRMLLEGGDPSAAHAVFTKTLQIKKKNKDK